ncbi:MAG: hypothetical protein ACRENI_13570 [Gemmatimonadaceae bacterium]
MMNSIRALAGALCAVVMLATASAATAQTPDRGTASIDHQVTAPTLEAASSAVRAPAGADAALDLSAEQARLQGGSGFARAEVLMIVGGAAFLAGAIIGGDPGVIVMVAGAGIGIYGLYLYLQ